MRSKELTQYIHAGNHERSASLEDRLEGKFERINEISCVDDKVIIAEMNTPVGFLKRCTR